MKHILPTAVICFGLGFAVAWMIRSEKPQEVAQGTESHEQKKKSSSSLLGSDPKEKKTPLARSARDSGNSEHAAKPKSSSKKISSYEMDSTKMFQSMQEKSHTSMLKKLASQLNLSPEQIKNLENMLAKRREQIAHLDLESAIPDDAVKDFFAPSKLDEEIMKELTEEQKSTLVEVRQDERKAKIDSNTLKSLGRVTEAITLTPEQRVAIYDTLAAQEEKRLNDEEDSFQMNIMDAMGMGGDEMGFHNMFTDEKFAKEAAEIGDNDPQAMVDLMRKAMTEKIDAQVNVIAPHLTEQQNQQYRQHQQQKIDAMMGVMESVQGVEQK